MDFRILGPVEAVVDGSPLPVRGRPLALLALLLIERGAVVARGLAVEALWGERPPTNPRNALQVVASRLRAVAGNDVVLHHAGGYALALPPGALDADRFEALLERGRLETAAGYHAAAAATLRGRP
jgi:DNA-binding SARP family transcriptional activator